jgi:hypothetical protein
VEISTLCKAKLAVVLVWQSSHFKNHLKVLRLGQGGCAVIFLLPNSIPRARCSFAQASQGRPSCSLLPSSPSLLLLLLLPLLLLLLLLLSLPWSLLLLLLRLPMLHMLQCSGSGGGGG